METMMTTTGWNLGLMTLWGLHILSVVAFFTGVLFLIVLAIKTFTPAQMKAWAIGLLVVGTIVCLFTVAIIGRPWIAQSYWGSGMNAMKMQKMGQMMEMMMEHNQGADSDEQREHGDMMQKMMGTSDISGSPQDEHHESSSSLSR